MQDNRKISIVIPNYNRTDLLIESFEKVYSDDRVSEIIVSDDFSEKSVYYELMDLFELMPKVKMFRNQFNQDCYMNKHTAMELATNEFCILADSDNIFEPDYIDRVYSFPVWDKNTIYAPSFAKPTFNYTEYNGEVITKENVSSFIDKPMFETALNTSNFFINRSQYLKTWDGAVDPVTSDSIYFVYCWLNAGNKFHIVDGMEYFHRVHDDSHYKINVARTPEGFHDSILNKLRQL